MCFFATPFTECVVSLHVSHPDCSATMSQHARTLVTLAAFLVCASTAQVRVGGARNFQSSQGVCNAPLCITSRQAAPSAGGQAYTTDTPHALPIALRPGSDLHGDET